MESLLPEEVLGLPAELTRVDALLDDPAFFAPFAPSTPVECYLRLMFLKFRYRQAVGKLVRTARRVRPAGGARPPPRLGDRRSGPQPREPVTASGGLAEACGGA